MAYSSAGTNALIWDLKERPTKKDGNGENLRSCAGVRATKRSILIFHFTIYPISNILFFLPLYLNIIFLIFLYLSSISLSFSSSLSLSYIKVCLVGIILKMMKKWEWKIWERMGEMGGGREMIRPDYFLSKPTKTWSP